MVPDFDKLPHIPIGLVRRYLAATGWRSVQVARSDVELYVLSEPGAPDLEILLPRVIFGEADGRVAAALRTIADVQDQDPLTVARAIKGIGFDIVRAALPDSVVSWDSISLPTAEEVIRRTRRLLAHAATNEVEPGKVAKAISSVGESYASRCRFAHTFRGSFGFTIESPVGPNSDMWTRDADPPPPPERRFMQRLIRGLRTVRAAGERADPELISRNFELGFNANMCDELVGIFEAAHAEVVRFDFVLSPEWKASDDYLAGMSAPIEIGERAIIAARDAADRLRDAKFDPEQTVAGVVAMLASSENPADLEHPAGSREVAIIWDGELGPIRVRVRLDPKTYLDAHKAHGEGRRVQVSGKLYRVGRRWDLREPHDFTVLS